MEENVQQQEAEALERAYAEDEAKCAAQKLKDAKKRLRKLNSK